MLKPARISIEEKELLEDWRRYGICPLIRDRALAVIQLIKKPVFVLQGL